MARAQGRWHRTKISSHKAPLKPRSFKRDWRVSSCLHPFWDPSCSSDRGSAWYRGQAAATALHGLRGGWRSSSATPSFWQHRTLNWKKNPPQKPSCKSKRHSHFLRQLDLWKFQATATLPRQPCLSTRIVHFLLSEKYKILCVKQFCQLSLPAWLSNPLFMPHWGFPAAHAHPGFPLPAPVDSDVHSLSSLGWYQFNCT